VLPGRQGQLVVVRHDVTRYSKKRWKRKLPPPVKVFSNTDLTLSLEDILREYGVRWTVEIAIRNANAFDGLGQKQCRKWKRIIGANTFQSGMTETRML
jgi:hypothetical protein